MSRDIEEASGAFQLAGATEIEMKLLEAALYIERGEPSVSNTNAGAAISDACRELQRQRRVIEKLRKIAAHVPARVYIEAKERAGFPGFITANEAAG